jgi:NADH-quinone oxidoreductase subunit M
MNDSSLYILSLLVFLPALGALVLAFLPSKQEDAIRYFGFGISLVTMILSFIAFFSGSSSTRFEAGVATMQSVFNVAWIPSFDIGYFMGVDGISFPLVMLTTVVSVMAAAASWSIKKHIKAYWILFLLLETGMIGVFLALDFFLFYVFWEVMLLPMYFLIGVWGGPRREYAAIKFFLYTLAGSVLMLIAILLLYFHSDLRKLAEADVAAMAGQKVDWGSLHLGDAEKKIGLVTINSTAGNPALWIVRRDPAAEAIQVSVVKRDATSVKFDAAAGALEIQLGDSTTANDVVKAIQADPSLFGAFGASVASGSEAAAELLPTTLSLPAIKKGAPVHTFNLLALAEIGQKTDQFSSNLILGASVSWWCFLLLLIGFIIKVPSVPFHTWLPDAHVEAPTPISMILAGVLLKMGGYGIIRICYPICPDGGFDLAWLVVGLGVVSMVYGAFAALAQKDFKRMVAYSSVSHMGYVMVGLGVWSTYSGNNFNADFWEMGVTGAMFQMIGHGISSPGMFLMVGIIYDRVHHRNLDEFGGIFGKMPVYTAMAMGIFFAGLGLPGLCGFIGEVFVVLSIWPYSQVLAVISAAVVILTAAYILWAIQRVYLGPEYKGPHEEEITPSNLRENSIGIAILALCILFGIFPYQCAIQYMTPTIHRQTQALAEWTRHNRPTAGENLTGSAATASVTPDSQSKTGG